MSLVTRMKTSGARRGSFSGLSRGGRGGRGRGRVAAVAAVATGAAARRSDPPERSEMRPRPRKRKTRKSACKPKQVKSSQVKSSQVNGPPSAISIDSRPPLLASGAHSIGNHKTYIVFELDRGGQVLLVVPRIEMVDGTIDKLTKVLAGRHIRIAEAHSDLEERNSTIDEFSRGEIDVLVATRRTVDAGRGIGRRECDDSERDRRGRRDHERA
jgi:primosomal protein N'